MAEQEIVNWLREAETVGDILKRLRQSQELTLQEIADYTGLAKSYISMIEHGQKKCQNEIRLFPCYWLHLACLLLLPIEYYYLLALLLCIINL